MREVRALFSFRASERCLAPSARRSLYSKLPAGLELQRQGALTVGRQASGSIPNAGEGGVRLEEVRHDLRAINTELVASDAANENQTKASGGADSSKRTKGSVLELHQRGIRLQGLRKVLSSIWTDTVVIQTANKLNTHVNGR